MSKSVMNQVIDYFSGSSLSKWRIDHKRLWLEYLKTGRLPFTPKELHMTIRDIADKPENRPRGEKLLCFRKRDEFTLKENKIPYRLEEALERFVTVSNGDNFFNQIPVGGGKESIDIVIRHGGDSVEFVELKPWNNSDSPLYALIEGLKNLIEYRVIVERKIKLLERPWKVDISMLAPEEYYRNFFLLDDSDTGIRENIFRATELLDEFAEEFGARLSIFSLALTSDSFNQACSCMYDQRGLLEQQSARVTVDDGITSLERSKWTELASSSIVNE